MIGRRRMRGPPAACTATTSAAVTVGTPSSPTPVGSPVEGRMWTSIAGASASLSRG